MLLKNDIETCYMCGKDFIAPYTMLQYKGHLYCSNDCLASDVEGVKEVQLLTIQDKEDEYADRLYDERGTR